MKERAKGAVGEVHAFEPNYEGSGIVSPASGRPSAKGSHRFDARAGHHLAPAMLSSGINVFEALGPGFTLLVLGAPPALVQAFRDAAHVLHMPLTIVEDAAEGEAARYQACLVLVRPDQFVAWASPDAQLGNPTPHQILALAKGSGDSPF